MDICKYAVKKNTLLYLDINLVEKAKKRNINISKLTEDALKQALQTSLPVNAQEYVSRVLADAGNEVARYGESYLLPFQIESLKLSNVGPLREFEATFGRNAPNLIVGPGGSGKSFILRSILLAFGKQHTSFQTLGNGKVMVKLFKDQDLTTITINAEDKLDLARGYRCLLLDDAFHSVSEGMVSEIFSELQKLRLQTIMATSRLMDPSKLPEGTNIVLLKR